MLHLASAPKPLFGVCFHLGAVGVYSALLMWHAAVCCASLLVAACYAITCALFCPDEHAEAGASQREQRQEQGRQQREADALKQQEKLRKRKEKKERRQSLAANTAAPRLSHVAQTDAGALPLFPEQRTDTKVIAACPGRPVSWQHKLLPLAQLLHSLSARQDMQKQGMTQPSMLCSSVSVWHVPAHATLVHSCTASFQAGI